MTAGPPPAPSPPGGPVPADPMGAEACLATLGNGKDHVYEWRAGTDPITDEHRIIDRSNRADMERLNSPSRRSMSTAALKRRNLLPGY